MTTTTHANLCFITAPTPGEILLNITIPVGEVVFDENGFARIAISRDHLAGIVLNAVPLLVREGK